MLDDGTSITNGTLTIAAGSILDIEKGATGTGATLDGVIVTGTGTTGAGASAIDVGTTAVKAALFDDNGFHQCHTLNGVDGMSAFFQ